MNMPDILKSKSIILHAGLHHCTVRQRSYCLLSTQHLSQQFDLRSDLGQELAVFGPIYFGLFILFDQARWQLAEILKLDFVTNPFRQIAIFSPPDTFAHQAPFGQALQRPAVIPLHAQGILQLLLQYFPNGHFYLTD